VYHHKQKWPVFCFPDFLLENIGGMVIWYQRPVQKRVSFYFMSVTPLILHETWNKPVSSHFTLDIIPVCSQMRGWSLSILTTESWVKDPHDYIMFVVSQTVILNSVFPIPFMVFRIC
jgi:hypothetical protein